METAEETSDEATFEHGDEGNISRAATRGVVQDETGSLDEPEAGHVAENAAGMEVGAMGESRSEVETAEGTSDEAAVEHEDGGNTNGAAVRSAVQDGAGSLDEPEAGHASRTETDMEIGDTSESRPEVQEVTTATEIGRDENTNNSVEATVNSGEQRLHGGPGATLA